MFKTKKAAQKAYATLASTSTIHTNNQLVVPGFSDVPGSCPILVQPYKLVNAGLGEEREIALIYDQTNQKFLICGMGFAKKPYKYQLAAIAAELLRCNVRCDWLSERIGASSTDVVNDYLPDGPDVGIDVDGSTYTSNANDALRWMTIQHNFGRRVAKRLMKSDARIVDKAVKTAAATAKTSPLDRFDAKSLKPEIKLARENSKAAARQAAADAKAARAASKPPKKDASDPLEDAAAGIELDDDELFEAYTPETGDGEEPGPAPAGA